MIRVSVGGYTIIETMIFLIVSAALFGGVVGAMSQQNSRERFNTSVNEVQSQLQDILNDTSTGYYPSQDDLVCAQSPTGPSVTSGATEKGTNKDCVFIGKVIQFAPDDTPSVYNSYSLVGNRLGTDISNLGKEVSTISESKPKLLGVGRPGIFDIKNIAAEVRITKVVTLDASKTSIGGMAVISDFSQSIPINNSVTGNSSRVGIAAVTGTSLAMTRQGFADAIQNTPANINTAIAGSGILICMREGDGRLASITIGGGGSQLSFSRTIDTWPGECN